MDSSFLSSASLTAAGACSSICITLPMVRSPSPTVSASSLRVSTVEIGFGNVAEPDLACSLFWSPPPADILAFALASMSGFSFRAILPNSHLSRLRRPFWVSSAHCLASSRSSKANTAML